MQRLSNAKRTQAFRTLAQLALASLAVMIIINCVPAAAQSDWRLFGGFSYMRSEAPPLLAPLRLDHIGAIGWGASITRYMSWARWFGATADFDGDYKNPRITIPANFFGFGVPATDTDITDAIHTSTYAAMLGQSFAYRNNSNIEPFAHVLLGGVCDKGSLTNKGIMLTGTSISLSDWAFGFALGGGADVKVSKLLAVRGQVDWIRSTFPDGEKDRQNNIRVMGGLVFRIGKSK